MHVLCTLRGAVPGWLYFHGINSRFELLQSGWDNCRFCEAAVQTHMVKKKTFAAAAVGAAVSNGRLWPILQPKGFNQSERKLFLRICVPNSGVLSKNESEQLQVLASNNVTYLKLIAEIETITTKLTKLKKQYDEEFSLFKDSPSVEIMSKDEFND